MGFRNWLSSWVCGQFARRSRRALAWLLPGLLFCLAWGCSLLNHHHEPSSLPPVIPASPSLLAVAQTNESVAPLPLKIEGLDPQKITLGQQLFEDPRLAADNTIACASCHRLQLGGTDRKPVSVGIGGAKSERNAPTVFNSAFNFRQFWDGRAESLEAQVDGPIQNAKEMGSSWPEVVEKLSEDKHYRRQFRQIYGSKHTRKTTKARLAPDITPETIRDALATYQRSLITPNAPFDRYLKGDVQALTAEQRQGYERFQSSGCISCHQGINLGGNMFQRFGVFGNYFEDVQTSKEDLGRYNVTGEKADRYVFKVPSLRNVELTPPYFHDGSVTSLAEAVRVMGQYQLGRVLADEDVDAIVEFLKSLTGETSLALNQEQVP